MTMPLFLQVSQYVGFFCSEFTNIILLYLIITKSSSKFGSYKYIMMSYAVFSISYGILEILTQPVMHIFGSCMIVYADSFLKFEKELAFQLVAIYCSTFGLCVLLLTTHFVFRYIVVCRPHTLHHLNGFKLIRIYILPLFFAFVWYILIILYDYPSDLKRDYMREIILELYDDDTFKVGFMAMMYHYVDRNGKFVICWGDFLSAFITCGIMELCIITMAICGWKTYWTLHRVRDSMSQKTKELNNQLFRTLLLQTLIPICTLFAPVGAFILFPIFKIGVGKLANAPSFYAGFYPGVDAVIIIFMIRDFRETVLCKKRRVVSNESTANGVTGRTKKPPALNSVGPTVMSGLEA